MTRLAVVRWQYISKGQRLYDVEQFQRMAWTPAHCLAPSQYGSLQTHPIKSTCQSPAAPVAGIHTKKP